MGLRLTWATIGLALMSLGCADRPRNLDELVEQDGLYLEPGSMSPYSGAVFEMYADDSTSVWRSGRLEDGLWQGPYEEFHRNGEVFSRGSMVDGVLRGARVVFFENGDTASVTTDHETWVEIVSYHRDGRISERTSYKLHADGSWGDECGAWFLYGNRDFPPSARSYPPCR